MLDYSELEEKIAMQSFADYINGLDFTRYYNQYIRRKKGGGRDRVSPKVYQPYFEKEKDLIKNRCMTGTYNFSPYNEKLLLKGKGKLPRVISVPSVRDRFVLSVLNRHLQSKLGIYRRTANSYVKDAKDFIGSHKGPLYFFKTDITAFFDSIPHNVLENKLRGEIDDICLSLVMKAIRTPTCEPGYKKHKENTCGIPQGISIASALSEKFMETFDNTIKENVKKHQGIYLRYVDDILILSPAEIGWKELIEKAIADEELGLQLTREKTKSGVLSETDFDYVGYSFTNEGVGIKLSNRRLFSDRIAGRCHKYVKQWKNEALRPRFLTSSDAFSEYSVMDINLLISGFRVESHNYGWLPYFQQITDIRILYELDNVVQRICKNTPISGQLNSFVKSYHSLRHRSGQPYLFDFNSAQTIIQKTTILQKMGRIGPSEHPTDFIIERRFEELIEDLTRNAKKDMKEQY